MKAVLTQFGVRKALTTKPVTMPDDQWDELDQKALSVIQLSLTTNVLREVIHETTTAAL